MPNVIEIQDLAAPALDVYARLTGPQLRHRAGQFVAESPKVIARALDAGCRPVSFLMERRHLTGDAAPLLARCPGTPVYTADREVLAALTGYTLTRGVLCAMERPVPADAAALCRTARRVAVLENIVDTTNLGAIFRSAAALHVDAVLLSPSCCDPLGRRSLRVSMGTVFQVPWAVLPGWPEEGLALLKQQGFVTAALALREDSRAIDDPLLRRAEKLALVLGTEGDGLAARTIAACDETVLIPMSHGVDSLNVAAAAAVAFWETRPRPAQEVRYD